ncbi:ADP-ribosylation factor family-domain-containing protein [Hyaloraphidium curvatum]|nr:ADP-ribosylation factor family-domain-containing protein [Hyaloraphidium curvatum]
MTAHLAAFLSCIGLKRPEHSKVFFVGQDCAGKTTLLYRLKLPEQDIVRTIPTLGFNVEYVRVRSPAGARDFVIWDVGGSGKMRSLWKHYFEGTELVVFFAAGEGCCAGRAEEVSSMLAELAEDESVCSKPFLVLVTKQDLPGAAGPDEFRRVHAKDLQKFPVMPPVLGISVTTRQGFDELASYMGYDLEDARLWKKF